MQPGTLSIPTVAVNIIPQPEIFNVMFDVISNVFICLSVTRSVKWVAVSEDPVSQTLSLVIKREVLKTEIKSQSYVVQE